MSFTGLFMLMSVSAFLIMPTIVSATCSAPYCPPPWRAFGAHCYQWIDKKMSWIDAERYCQMLSHPGKMVHLASIANEEKHIIGQYAEDRGQAVWIGLFNNSGQNFQWVDGSPADSLCWQKAQPSYDGDCVEWFQAMNDRPCETEQTFVCKF
ncbi:C-type lectin LmsL-like [Patiria miniata]|uniref:C-type lectin domain-containing protein n=1 Tax=Patiria miniata TaxID=46514 RepID=A0A914B241_PATMI|nr:C-type lectin LmsL-like [Patiria miniata]